MVRGQRRNTTPAHASVAKIYAAAHSLGLCGGSVCVCAPTPCMHHSLMCFCLCDMCCVLCAAIGILPLSTEMATATPIHPPARPSAHCRPPCYILRFPTNQALRIPQQGSAGQRQDWDGLSRRRARCDHRLVRHVRQTPRFHGRARNPLLRQQVRNSRLQLDDEGQPRDEDHGARRASVVADSRVSAVRSIDRWAILLFLAQGLRVGRSRSHPSPCQSSRGQRLPRPDKPDEPRKRGRRRRRKSHVRFEPR